MYGQDNMQGCRMRCWMTAGGIGFLTFLILLAISGQGFFASLVLGVLVAVLLGPIFVWLYCAEVPQPKPSAVTSTAGTAAAGAMASGDVSARPAGTGGTVAPAPEGPAEPEAKAEEPEAEESKAEEAKADTKAAADEAVAPAKPSDADDNAKGTGSGSPMKPSAALAGEDELAARKGEWKYEGGARAGTSGSGTGADSKDKAAEASESASKAPAAEASATTEAGGQPEGLDGPREGGADNLKEIKGVGPKLEDLLNSMGFYHFDQIAAWTESEVAWVDENLKGFKGRVTRDDWVAQAKVLASGEETEFSKRVDQGKVY